MDTKLERYLKQLLTFHTKREELEDEISIYETEFDKVEETVGEGFFDRESPVISERAAENLRDISELKAYVTSLQIYLHFLIRTKKTYGILFRELG